MPGEHQRITKIIAWIIALSMIAYFVLTPLTFLRPTPQQVVPQPEEVAPVTPPPTEFAPSSESNVDIFNTDVPTPEPTQ